MLLFLSGPERGDVAVIARLLASKKEREVPIGSD
jgi:hypothetical protein